MKIIIKVALAIVFYCLAGAANGSMDTLKDHYATSIFPQTEFEQFLGKDPSFWDPRISWICKYKDWPQDQRPAFPGAKTWAVGFTDGWHFFQMLQLAFLRTTLVLLLSCFIRLHPKKPFNSLFWFLIWIALIMPYALGFHLTYTFLLIQ